MTAEILARSPGAAASRSIIEAMIRTSYFVRPLERAYAMSTCDQLSSNAASCWSISALGFTGGCTS